LNNDHIYDRLTRFQVSGFSPAAGHEAARFKEKETSSGFNKNRMKQWERLSSSDQPNDKIIRIAAGKPLPPAKNLKLKRP
jgi:hypothetical protein